MVREFGGPEVLVTSDVRDPVAGRGEVVIDVILDNVGGAVGEAAFALLAPGGRFSAHDTPSGRFAAIDAAEVERRGVTVRGIADVQLTDAEAKRLTEEALAEAAAVRIEPVIGQTFPLARVADAHAAIEGRGVFGKTLLIADRVRFAQRPADHAGDLR